jgi:hypothetical protein
MLSLARRVERHAADPELRRSLKQGNRDKLTAVLEKYLKANPRGEISRYLVADRRGNTVSLFPMEEALLNINFAWRDWFNGSDDYFDRKDKSFEPIGKTHISQPFVGRTSERPRIIVISTPVFDSEHPKQVAGVLLGAILLDDLHSWLRDAITFQHGFVVLINEHGQYLLHKDMEAITPRYLEKTPRYTNPVFQEVLAGKEGSETYKDPIDHKTYLAGYAPLKSIGWGALVQHDRHAALEPIAKLKRDLAWNFWIAMISAGVLISAMWIALLWTLRRSARKEGV